MAMKLANGIKEAGYSFIVEPASNQIFPILPNKLIDKLRNDYQFYPWSVADKDNSSIRLVTSWATKEKEVDAFIEEIKTSF